MHKFDLKIIKSDPALPFNQLIDGELYKFEYILGKGAFGTVYKCRMASGQNVAVKKITDVRTCWMEAKIMSQLRGPEYEPYFVQCHKIYRTSVAMFLVMEYCPDGSLEHFIRRKGRLEYPTAARHFAHLIIGIGKMHKSGLMHRDLKPANILVARRNDGSIKMKIADFGISKAASSKAIYQTLCGTPYYMAPEIRMGHRYDKSADIYSLGAIMFFMLRARHPAGLHFDRCGYPDFPDRPLGYSHTSISGRMMCRRKEERLGLDQLQIQNGNEFCLNKIRHCAICGRKLSK